MRSRIVAFVIAIGVLASGPACAKKNEDKLSLQKLLQASAHASGVFRYSDRTPKTPFDDGSLVQVRGLLEDDFRYKARMSVDGQDVLDEVVNDDALAVRFLDPSFVSKFTSREGGDVNIKTALSARYWVTDPVGAPSIGDAAVADRTIGIDPIVDSLSAVDYAVDAVAAAKGVFKWNAERLDYRPNEDPFPRPAQGSGVTRWDIEPPDMPRADAIDTGQSNASLARTPQFRKMAIYVKNGKVVQIREQIAAKFDLLTKFRTYLEHLAEKQDANASAALKKQLDKVKDQPDVIEAFLNFAFNQVLKQAGEQPVRFRTMVYEFTKGAGVRADLPFGPDVKQGSLGFFGVNSKTTATNAAQIPGQVAGSNETTQTTQTTQPATGSTATTAAP
jgi:hypothetical protein